MKKLITLCFAMVLLASCKTETNEKIVTTETISEEKKVPTVAENIANAHGFEHWKKINKIEFTFNVDRGDNHFERSWEWQPKKNLVTSLISKDSVVSYTRPTKNEITKIEPEILMLDQGFINDKFWMLIPFQLIWDEGTTFSSPVKSTAPISKTESNMITLTYGSEGGYTPGDAYDIFYDEHYKIKEWVYRKGNIQEPSMATTFENYENFQGILIAKEHKTAEDNFNLYFSNIKIE